MNEDLKKAWRALRPIIKESFSFNETKDMIAAAALPVEKISHLQQKSLPAKGASKGELLDALDNLIYSDPDPENAIKTIVAEMLKYKNHLENKFSDCVKPYNWKIADGRFIPSDFQIDDAICNFSEEVKNLLDNAYKRYSNHDYSGAMTAICGALDTVTGHLYRIHDLGNPHNDAFQKRISCSFAVFEPIYRKEFSQITNDDTEINKLWQNYKGAINQAAYVMGEFRRKASDAHGTSACSPKLIRHAIDSGTFIIRSITSEF